MPVRCGLLVDRTAQIQGVDDPPGRQREVLPDQLHDPLVGNLAGSEGVHVDRGGLRNPDGIGKLELALVREPCGDNVLGHVARGVRARAVNLRRILAGECAAAVPADAAIGINDDLPSGHSCVPFRPADDELAGGIDVDGCALIKQHLPRLLLPFFKHRPDHLLNDVFPYLVLVDILPVLLRDHDSIHPDRLPVVVLNRNLALAVRPEVVDDAFLPDL